jgi:hypothetical protein
MGASMGVDRDLELLQRWREGDQDAGELLLARHFDAVCRFFRNKVGDAAPDLIQRSARRRADVAREELEELRATQSSPRSRPYHHRWSSTRRRCRSSPPRSTPRSSPRPRSSPPPPSSRPPRSLPPSSPARDADHPPPHHPPDRSSLRASSTPRTRPRTCHPGTRTRRRGTDRTRPRTRSKRLPSWERRAGRTSHRGTWCRARIRLAARARARARTRSTSTPPAPPRARPAAPAPTAAPSSLERCPSHPVSARTGRNDHAAPQGLGRGPVLRGPRPAQPTTPMNDIICPIPAPSRRNEK